ncbi:MAG: YicC family protein, partial [Alcaligenaceae bacterium]|nr:YicC family protein [Alcaligenaceae bacterium]
MILSMTAFGAARIENEHGALTIEVRSINNRYLDLNLRLPDELRFAESKIRERIARHLARGKVEFRVNYSLTRNPLVQSLDTEALQMIARQLEQARQFIPDTPAPTLASLLQNEGERNSLDPEQW